MKLYIDPGHGGKDPGAIGYGLSEKEIVLDIAKRLRFILLSKYKGIDIRLSRTGDITKSLWQRTSEANHWGADYFVSIHCNAFNGQAEGYEDFIYNKLSNTSPTARYQRIVHEEIIKRSGLKNRGRKKANFHVLRETAMPAILTENGFIDHQGNAMLMKQASWREKIAEGHAAGIAKAFKLQRKQVNTPGTSHAFRVIAGSFRNKQNAEKRIDYLKSNGIQATIMATKVSNATLYRVQAGTFQNKNSAKQQVQAIEQVGVDAFILGSK